MPFPPTGRWQPSRAIHARYTACNDTTSGGARWGIGHCHMPATNRQTGKPANQPAFSTYIRTEGHTREAVVPSHYALNSASIPGQPTIQSLAVSSTFRIVVVRCISRTPCFLTLPVEARSPPPLASYAHAAHLLPHYVVAAAVCSVQRGGQGAVPTAPRARPSRSFVPAPVWAAIAPPSSARLRRRGWCS